MTDGLEVLVQDVMAAITTEPCPIVFPRSVEAYRDGP